MTASYDTVGISRTTILQPDPALLAEYASNERFSCYTGEPKHTFINPSENVIEPRITITRWSESERIIYTEVSIGEWLYGSNLHSPTQEDIERFLKKISEFVISRTGIPFDAWSGRVARADIFQDFPFGTVKGVQIIRELAFFKIAKYNTNLINGSTVNFDNAKGPKSKKYKLNKRGSFYNKQQQLIDSGAGQTEIELAQGLFRFEIQHRNNVAVTNLKKSRGLPDHTARNVLQVGVAEWLMEKELKRLKLQPIFERETSGLERLIEEHGFEIAQVLAGHLVTKSHFGTHYQNLPFVTVSDRTIKRRDKLCAEAGVLSL